MASEAAPTQFMGRIVRDLARRGNPGWNDPYPNNNPPPTTDPKYIDWSMYSWGLNGINNPESFMLTYVKGFLSQLC